MCYIRDQRSVMGDDLFIDCTISDYPELKDALR